MCKVEKLSDISLLALCGKLAGRRFKFLLDSGASCNFIGLNKLVELCIDYDIVIS
jgi:hypothetical protein